MDRSELLVDLIKSKYQLKSKYLRQKVFNDDVKRQLANVYVPFIQLMKGLMGDKNKSGVGKDAMTETYTPLSDRGIQTEPEKNPIEFLREEESFGYDPEMSLQERFAEQSENDRSRQLEELPAMVRPYIDMLLMDDVNLDKVYGIHLNESNELQIGNLTADIDPVGADIILSRDLVDETGNVTKQVVGEFEGTPGLYSLLFTKSPGYYTETDRDNYKKILYYSDAIKARPDRFSHKYKTVISAILTGPN